MAGALDAIGFGPGPQETTPVNGLLSLVDGDLPVPDPKNSKNKLPRDTAGTGSAVRRSRAHGERPPGLGVGSCRRQPAWTPSGRGGQLGLNLLADQADELFFIIEAILQGERTVIGLPELFDPQVQIELRSLARDLSELADQGI